MIMTAEHKPLDLDPQTAAFYRDVMERLAAASVPFLVGGAYAFEVYTDLGGRTKDLDIFMKPGDVKRALMALRRKGYEAAVHSPHWIAKVRDDGHVVDIIYNSGNGLCPVDDSWFDHAPPAEVLGQQVRLMPIEEMIWQKAYIQERERYDGADVMHLIRVHGRTLDWERLRDRFADNWPVLLAHLVLYDYVYPSERDRVPTSLIEELLRRLAPQVRHSIEERICNGTILSRAQYLPDVEEHGFVDGRLEQMGGGLSKRAVDFETERLRNEQALEES
jgi:hypothetical protein